MNYHAAVVMIVRSMTEAKNKTDGWRREIRGETDYRYWYADVYLFENIDDDKAYYIIETILIIMVMDGVTGR